MEVIPDGAIEPGNDFQVVNPGVSMTPAKAVFLNSNLLCQEQMLDHGNWFGSYEPGIGVNPEFLGANAAIGYQFQAETLQNSSFRNLLELMTAGSNGYSGRASLSNAIGDAQSGMSHLSSSQVYNYLSSSPYGLSSDFNLVPGAIPDVASSGRMSTQFSPITSNQATMEYKEHVSNARKTSVPNTAALMENGHCSTDIELNVHQQSGYANTELKRNADSVLLDDQSSVTLPVDLYENDAPDKGGGQVSELIMTPQQKSRKKKHRPKVVIEGQPKRTPKPRTPKPAPEGSPLKRKYVRRSNNATATPSQNGTDNTYPMTTPPGSETLLGKREYARTKEASNPESAPLGDRMSINSDMIRRHTRSSCKKSLNFESENSQINNTSGMSQDVVSDMPARDQLSLTTMLQHPLELSLSQGKPSIPFNKQTLHTSTNGHQTEFSMGKCQIFFSDASHDKEVNKVQLMMGNDSRCVRETPSISNYSTSACLTQETEAKQFKRQYFQDFEAEICGKNWNGVKYNSLRSYESAAFPNGMTSTGLSSMVFPIITKKKRTTKWNRAETSKVNSTSAVIEKFSTQNAYYTSEAQENHLTPSTSWVPATQCDLNRNSRYAVVNYATLNEKQTSSRCLDIAEYRNAKRKRSKGPTRPRSTPLGSCEQLLNYRKESRIHEEVINQPNRCMEQSLSHFPAAVKTKKRSKRNSITSSTLSYLYNQQNSLRIGQPLAITWKPMCTMDEIIERLSLLDINAESTLGLYHNQNAVLQMSHLEQNSLVVYQRDGTIVPVRKRKPRPKVDLDDETTRVWKLLLEDIRNEGIDGTDEEKARWWEEERRVFRGRADSFIARMHLVQGDRRFTPWKGSVVDSVVGVFLTQNVSDHLSSSAFMSLAARYPPKAHITPEEPLGEETSMTNGEPEVLVLEPDEIVTCHEKPDQFTEAQGPQVWQHLEGDRGKESNKVAGVDVSAIQVDIASTENSVDSSISRSEKSEVNSLGPSEEESTKSEKKHFRSPTTFVELIHTVGGNPELEEVFQSTSEANLLEQTDWCCTTEAFSSQISHVISSGLHEDPISGSQECCKYDDKETCTTENSGLSAGSPNQTTVERSRRAQFEELPKSSSEDENSCYNHGFDVSLGAIEDPESAVESLLQHQEFGSHNHNATTPVVNGRNMVAKSLPDLNENPVHSTFNADSEQLDNIIDSGNADTPKAKVKRPGKQNQVVVDWDILRKEVQKDSIKKERTPNTMDSLDWETIRCADVNEIADTIKSRGMNNMLAERIKDFLDRIVREHGSIDLEWLRDVLPDKAKEYLLSIRGLGLKSVECVRLLTLHHLAFPVDVNVGRIAVRLGWVPLQPLPESLQLHLLELYPVLESIQKYLWPRLCKLDQRTLYELHYQMITFGKVFCTKSKPNCNACPMRGECRHFASAFASARLTLPAPEEKRIVANVVEPVADSHSTKMHSPPNLYLHHANRQLGDDVQSSVASGSSNSTDLCLSQFNKHLGANSESSSSNPTAHGPATTEPQVEEPPSPEPEHDQFVEPDMEDFEDPDEIPTIRLNMEEFAQNLQNLVGGSMELQEHEISKALVALTAEATSLPAPKLKNINRLRTEHQVYELPDSHPLLHRFDRREPDDPSPYLLAIWTPGETADSIQPPEGKCRSQETGGLCDDETCFSCNSVREASSQIVRGTILVPCRTAMRGSFPLNGTYFQVNEMFADHDSSLTPVAVPRAWIWNLPRRTVYFGTSVPSIFKGLNTEEIQYCFWRGFVCVRGFEQCSRSPKPLMARLHFPASRMRGKGKVDE